MKQTPEGKVLSDIVKYLDKRGIFWLRLNTEGTFRNTKNGYQYVPSKYSKPGTPDLVCFAETQAVFLEVKRPKGGRLSADQIFMKQVIEDAGLEWHCVRSVDEVKELGLKP